MRKTIIYFLTFLLFISVANASGIVVTPKFNKTDVLYAGETFESKWLVKNTNSHCPIKTCAYSPPLYRIEGFSVGTPIETGQSSDLNIVLRAPETGPGVENLKLTVSCEDETEGILCFGLDSDDDIEIQLRWEWCGDTKCNEEKEACDSCPEDCGKCDGEPCEEASECFGKYCVHNICSSKPFIIGDGYCDEGESCDNSPTDCEEKFKCKKVEEIEEEKIPGAETAKEGLWNKYKLPLIIAGIIALIIIISALLGKFMGPKEEK